MGNRTDSDAGDPIARDWGSSPLAGLTIAHFKAIIESSDDAIIGKTLDGIVTSWNRGAEVIFGYSQAEMMGRSLLVLFPEDRKDEERFIVEQLLLGEKVDHFETVRICKDGKPVHVSVTISPIRNADGVIVGASKVARDITPEARADMALRDREQRLSRVLEGSDQGYWDWNIQTNDLLVSARWETMLGYEAGEMDVANGRWAQVVHPDDLTHTMELVQRHLSGEVAMFENEFRCRTKLGDWRWILSRGRVVERDAHGRPMMMSGTHTDISERKKFELSQRQSLTVFTNSYEGIMVVDPRRQIIDVNPAFTRITGYTRDEALGKSPALLSSGRQSPSFYREMWQCIRATGQWTGEIWNRRKNGEIYAQLLSVSAVTGGDGVVQHYIGMFADISQLKAHEEELNRIAHYDPLTGAPNRRLLVDRLALAIARSNRNGLLLAVCYLDLDGFKSINDRYGHSVGDKLLVGVTDNLKLVLRSEDTLARLGGDEFMLLLADIGSPQECALILDRILGSASETLEVDGHTVAVSASIGVSLYPQDHSDVDTLIRHADQAMYVAKDAGKNRFHLFDPESDRKAQEHRQQVDRLVVALEREEFCLHYQPQVDLLSGHILGVEALIRWQHPELGLLSPADFLPYIEGSKLECPVGNWVLRTALRQTQQWQAQGIAVNVGVNVSARHLLSAEFQEDLRQALAMYPSVCAECLELEILESTAIEDIAVAASVLYECRAMGVRLALDDFGTGYSSLTYLRKLPFDLLKIDQSFVRDMLRDPEDRSIVEGVIRLATAFNRSVIAEGVETLEHGAALLQLGCRLVQGYGIARPMAPERFAEWSVRWQNGQIWRQLQN